MKFSLGPLKPYVDLLKGLGWLCLFGFFFWMGGLRQENACMKADNKLLERAQEERDDAQDALTKALKKVPNTGKKVSDAVTANPTSPECRVPDAVADGLQDGIDAGKAATR